MLPYKPRATACNRRRAQHFPDGPAQMECTIVDVFAERPLAGNPLAVVRDCAHLSTKEMQAIAREMNFSETTFVVAESEDAADVRIFTPAEELPFAGHPTLGTAWVLAQGRGGYTLRLRAGPVSVRFASDGIGWMDPPEPTLDAVLDPDEAAALVGVSASALDDALPHRRAQTGGLAFAFVGVRTLEVLDGVHVDPAVHARLQKGGPFLGVFAFAPAAADPEADFAARMFFNAFGWREDPATGSANVAFAALLRAAGTEGRVVVDQGTQMGRPSRLYLEIGEAIRLGGKVQPVMTGTFRLPRQNDA